MCQIFVTREKSKQEQRVYSDTLSEQMSEMEIWQITRTDDEMLLVAFTTIRPKADLTSAHYNQLSVRMF